MKPKHTKSLSPFFPRRVTKFIHSASSIFYQEQSRIPNHFFMVQAPQVLPEHKYEGG